MPEELIEYMTSFPARDDGDPWTAEQAKTGEGKPVYSADGDEQIGELTSVTVDDNGTLLIVYGLQREHDGRLAIDYDDEQIHRALLLNRPFATI